MSILLSHFCVLRLVVRFFSLSWPRDNKPVRATKGLNLKTRNCVTPQTKRTKTLHSALGKCIHVSSNIIKNFCGHRIPNELKGRSNVYIYGNVRIPPTDNGVQRNETRSIHHCDVTTFNYLLPNNKQ